MNTRLIVIAIVCCALAGCLAGARRAPEAEATSLLGERLVVAPIDAERLAKLEDDLRVAKAALDADERAEEALVWYGRRLAYLGRYREAIAVYTRGLAMHPDGYRLLRHRGHRYITIRELDRAIADLARAAVAIEGVPDEVEPDGQPNERDQPRSTTNSNIWYHLGLAYYLKGQFGAAAECWAEGLEFSRVNDDMLVATSYWLYLARRRAGMEAEAAAVLEPIRAEMDIIENQQYHRLLLMFKGELTSEEVLGGTGNEAIADATAGYGVGVWKLLRGDESGATAMFRWVVAQPQWAAFGHIAAEAELARRR